MGTLQSFNARIDAFLVQMEMSPTRFGVLAANDPNFVFRLRRKERPRCPRADTIDRIERWMRTYETERESMQRKCA